MAKSYKSLKEDFVTGLKGGSIPEINYVTAVAPIAVLLSAAIESQYSLFTPYGLQAFIVDFLLQCCGILFATTVYSSQPATLILSLLLPALVILATNRSNGKEKIAKKPPAAKEQEVSPRSRRPVAHRPFITNYRGTMMIVTCLSILAVDFKVFPRRFAKVETWGTSLMDMGVGSFVFSAGVVSAGSVLKSNASGSRSGLLLRLRTAARHSFPLLVLGFVRLWSVKGLDYAEHVTEYGVHWNFFFTLALLPPFIALCQSVLAVLPFHALLAVIMAGVYQILLEITQLKSYILISPRTDLLSKNREGVFSLAGYLAIFLCGQGTGLSILDPTPRYPRLFTFLGRRSPIKSLWAKKLASQSEAPIFARLLLSTALYAATFWSVYSVRGFSLDVSRRLANLPYVVWVAAFNCAQLGAFCFADLIARRRDVNPSPQEERQGSEDTSRIIKAFNRNGLALFLVANLLTGLVNLTLPTIDMTALPAMGILVGYALVLAATAVYLDSRGVSLKL